MYDNANSTFIWSYTALSCVQFSSFRSQSLPFTIWYQFRMLCLMGVLHPLALVQTGVRKGWLGYDANWMYSEETWTSPSIATLLQHRTWVSHAVAYPGFFFRRVGGVQPIQLRTEDRENGDLGGGSPLVRGSGGSCSFIQEISFHIVKFS